MKKNIILSIVINMLILSRDMVSLPFTPVLQEENVEQAFENVLPAAVRLQAGEMYGSGSIYEITTEEVIVATAGHLLSNGRQEWEVTFFDGEWTIGRPVSISDGADVGFIAVSLSDLPKEELMKLCRVTKNPHAWHSFNKNSRFFMIDMVSDGGEPTYFQGALVEKEMFLPDYGRIMMYGDAYAHPGMSGCGIFDGYGNFVGILSGATEQNEIAAVPLSEIEEAYKKPGLFQSEQ